MRGVLLCTLSIAGDRVTKYDEALTQSPLPLSQAQGQRCLPSRHARACREKLKNLQLTENIDESQRHGDCVSLEWRAGTKGSAVERRRDQAAGPGCRAAADLAQRHRPRRGHDRA